MPRVVGVVWLGVVELVEVDMASGAAGGGGGAGKGRSG